MATQQEPITTALANFAEDCVVFAAAPTAASTGQFDHSWRVDKVHLVPDHCEKEVVIPANSCRLSLFDDNHKIVVIATDPLAGAEMRRYVELNDKLEVVLPGGGLARVSKLGDSYTVMEDTNDDK